MPSFPSSSNALPSVYSEVVTNSRGVSVPGGVRTLSILGEGQRTERLVSAAIGSGKDGFSSDFSSTANSDGRHFKTLLFPHISNRTDVYKNGIKLTGLEEALDDNSFDSRYEYRLDIETGQIELQSAALVDQGGAFYSASSLNVGNGVISSLSLLDSNAPTENWSIRCVSVRRDGAGTPIDGYAKFIAQGSVSGIILDGYGNAITWQSNGTLTNNGILEFSLADGSTPFVEGDKFTVKVKSGALVKNDSLVVNYIAETDLNDPEFFTDMGLLTTKHGMPSLTNRLSLGAQLAFANNGNGVWAVQTKPAVPRRISYVLEESATGDQNDQDLEFRLPLNVVPDSDANIHFFVTDPVTQVETQIVPNKVDYFDATFTANPHAFITSPSYEYSYTVILDPNYESIQSDLEDGELTVVTGTTATLSSADYLFTSADAGATRRVEITSGANIGIYSVVSVSNGVATISSGSGFTTETSVHFNVLDTSSSGAVVLFTEDLALTAGQKLRATIVDVKDADFFDVGWEEAFEALEKINVSIVVPLPSQTISAIFAAGRVHCETMSNIKNKRERVLFIGAIAGLTPDQVTGIDQAAVEDIGILEGIQGDDVSELLAGDTEDLTDYSVTTAFGGSFRVVYFYPDEIVVQIGADRTKIDGFFMAAAAAGYLTSVPNVAIPLTRKVLTGFAILRDKIFRPIVLEQIAAAGISVLQPVVGGGICLWGKTTTTSGFVEEIELSIIFIRDRIAQTLRAGFEGFIGQPADNTTQATLLNRLNSLLASFLAQGLITNFGNQRVVQDSVDPTQWNVSCAVVPVYGINFVYIRVSVGSTI